MQQFQCDHLQCKIFEDRLSMGKTAAKETAQCLRFLLAEQEELCLIFAAAPSQKEFLDALLQEPVDWHRIRAFHLDEYLGLPPGHPKTFSSFLKRTVFDKLPFKAVEYMRPDGQAREEAERYAELLQRYPLDVVLCGIGQNGHLAFNDPGVADFQDQSMVKVVALDAHCRQQQVDDACFARLDDVPTHALTVTLPPLMKAAHRFCVVPDVSKALAIQACLQGPISEACPASILRTAPQSTLYLDRAAASLLSVEGVEA